MWIWEQTAIISLCSINWLVCITETECVYCAVRTESFSLDRVNLTRPTWGSQQRVSTLQGQRLCTSTVHLHTYHSVRQACQLSTALSHWPFSLSLPVPSLIPCNKSLFHKLSHSGAREFPTVCTKSSLLFFTEPMTNVACSGCEWNTWLLGWQSRTADRGGPPANNSSWNTPHLARSCPVRAEIRPTPRPCAPCWHKAG